MAAEIYNAIVCLNYERARLLIEQFSGSYAEYLLATAARLTGHPEGPALLSSLIPYCEVTLHATDEAGRGLLHYVVQMGYSPAVLELCSRLCQCGLVPHADHDGMTPLHLLALQPAPAPALVELLLQHTAPPLLASRVVNPHGETLLFIAGACSLSFCSLLAPYVDLLQCDSQGNNLAAMAVKTNNLPLLHWFCRRLHTLDPSLRPKTALALSAQLAPRMGRSSATLSRRCLLYADLYFGTTLLAQVSVLKDKWSAVAYPSFSITPAHRRFLVFMSLLRRDALRDLLPTFAAYLFPAPYVPLVLDILRLS